jgi:fluoride exporter
LLSTGGKNGEMTYIWIAVGSALGGAFRYWCSGIAARLIGETFPWGTLFINILGSFVIGLFFTLTGPDGRLLVSSNIRQFVMVGLCGGYTTFSSFSLQTLNLIRDGDLLYAGANIVGSVLLCMLAVWIGHVMAAQINQL